MALFKYIVLSVCLCGIHLNGFAQSTREAILELSLIHISEPTRH